MENVLVDDANDAGEAYELLHMLRIETDNLTSLNASVIHVAVSKGGNCSLMAYVCRIAMDLAYLNKDDVHYPSRTWGSHYVVSFVNRMPTKPYL